MEGIFEFLKGFDLQQIISTVAIVYFITNKNFKEIKEDLKEVTAPVAKAPGFLGLDTLAILPKSEAQG